MVAFSKSKTVTWNVHRSLLLLIRVDFGMGFFRDPEFPIPIPGIRKRDFLFWARSKNPEFPGIGFGIWKPQKIPEKSREQTPENPKIPGIGVWIWKFRKNPEIYSFWRVSVKSKKISTKEFSLEWVWHISISRSFRVNFTYR